MRLKPSLTAEDAYIGLWKLGYILLRGTLRVLIGKKRRQRVQIQLGLHYKWAENVRYGTLSLGYEPFVKQIIRSKLKEGSVFLDIGGGIGTHALEASKVVGDQGKIVIMEPDPINRTILKEQAWNSRDVTIYPKAVWTVNGTEDFSLGAQMKYDPRTYSHTGTLIPKREHYNSDYVTDVKIRMPCVRLDSLLRKLKQVDLAKVDIEGAEYNVFTDPGLNLSRLKALVIELHGPYPNPKARKLIQNLQKKGFNVFAPRKSLVGTSHIHIFAERFH